MAGPGVEFVPDGLARPPGEVLDALVIAAWELRCAPGDLRIRGAVEAGQWLGQVRRLAPVTSEDRVPVLAAVTDEHDQALAVVYGLPHAVRTVDTDYARGVAQMLSYALDPLAAPPVALVHKRPA